MTIHEASRTLLKSPPELWAECSDAASLMRHLDRFGEIRITRLEPETAIAWEGENVSGTVKLEPSGWGTRVILTAEAEDVENDSGPPAASEPSEEPRPPAPAEPLAPAEPVAVTEPDPVAEPDAVVEPDPVAEPDAVVEPDASPEPAALPEPANLQPQAEVKVKLGFFARIRSKMRSSGTIPVEARPPEPEADSETLATDPAAETQLEPEPEPHRTPEPDVAPTAAPEVTLTEEPRRPPTAAPDLTPAAAALAGALESLGMAHHRPFSRS